MLNMGAIGTAAYFNKDRVWTTLRNLGKESGNNISSHCEANRVNKQKVRERNSV